MGQSPSRHRPQTADQPDSQSHQRRRLRARGLRPTSFIDGSSHGRIDAFDENARPESSNAAVNASTTRSRPRSVVLSDIFHRPRPEQQQTRTRSRSRSQTRRYPLQPWPTLARRIFHRNRAEDIQDSSDVAQPWSVAPRDSLDMAHAARDRGSPRLPDIVQDPLGIDVDQPMLPSPPSDAVPTDPLTNNTPEAWTTSSLAHRLSALRPARELRRWASIRRQHNRHSTPAEQNAATLQRLLSVAAAATAASLMGGNPEAAVNDLRRTAVAVEGEDGSFDSFLQALRSGRLASHLGRNGANVGADGDSGDDGQGVNNNPNSLDFFRMFRFGPNNQSRSRYSAPQITGAGQNDRIGGENNDNTSARPQGSEQNEASEARTVSVLIVGIRSLNQDADASGGPDGGDAMPSFIDALTNHNTTINVGLQNAPTGVPVGTPRTGFNLSALSRGRRASMPTPLSFRDRPRRARPGGRPLSEIGPSMMPAMPDLIESPVAPVTSDEQFMNDTVAAEAAAASTGQQSTEEEEANVERPNTSSSVPPSPMSGRMRFRDNLRDSWRQSWRDSWRDSWGSRRSTIDELPEDRQESSMPRWSRQRSQSHALRFGSGSTRRNGMVEPDHLTPETESNRSWIIYVLGGSYPENHPILTTPSLFTEHPTYEDMLLLSSLLGPAKPPVAQQQDVDSSGGLFRFDCMGEKNIAHGIHVDGDDGFIETLVIDPGQDCQICLSNYTLGEVARRLNDCKHLYHRECIDVWLTTGRNSCPLCRNQGVLEKTPPPDPNIQMTGAPGSSRAAAAAADSDNVSTSSIDAIA